MNNSQTLQWVDYAFTAKILTPNKRVLMPTLEATCSLDLGCPIEEFSQFCDQHPDRKVVVYANTSAAVKARALEAGFTLGGGYGPLREKCVRVATFPSVTVDQIREAMVAITAG